ncbi:hypothetical protein K9L16_03555 [Candidatus Pacearchaeota archaeon]|nr:hypothetical protein [Candidatus Pacearchaeota archaeon]
MENKNKSKKEFQNNEKIKIGVDIDDVLVDTLSGFISFCKTKGLLEEVPNLHSYYFHKEMNLSEKDLTTFFKEFNNSNFRKFPPFKIAVDSVNLLSGNFEIFFITSRPLELKEETFDMLKRFFTEFNFELIFSQDYFDQNVSKSEICNELGISVLIEDRRKYALDCAEKGIKVFLIDKPWNSNCEHENIVRVENWDEILEKLNVLNVIENVKANT